MVLSFLVTFMLFQTCAIGFLVENTTLFFQVFFFFVCVPEKKESYCIFDIIHLICLGYVSKTEKRDSDKVCILKKVIRTIKQLFCSFRITQWIVHNESRDIY